MRRQTIAWVFAAFAAAGLTGVGCGEDDERRPGTIIPPGTGGRTTPGTGGRAPTPGTGGMMTPPPPGTGGMMAPPPPDAGPDPLPDATPEVPGTGGTVSTTPDAEPDLPPPPPDLPPPPPDLPPPPPDVPSTMVTVTDCSQINCPALLGPAASCNGSEQSCTQSTSMSGANTIVRYCHANNVKKLATQSGTRSTLEIRRPDGSGCYNLEINHGSGGIDTWIYRTPGGSQIATATANTSTHVISLTCNGVTYAIDTDNVDCPATDGEPSPGECTAGTCSIP